MEQHRIRIHGHEIAYLTAGEGPAVVLIHGMAGSSAMWQHVVPGLAEHYRVIAPDLLGHGDSDKPRADYTLGAFASDLRDLLNALGVSSATIVGQSFGGGVAMQFVHQFRERCERLVLVASGGLGEEVHPLLRALSVPGAEWLLRVGCAPGVREVGAGVIGWIEKRGWHPGPVMAEIGRSYSSLGDPATRTAFLHTLRSVVDHAGQRVSAREKLAHYADLPTLIVWGTHDHVIPVQHALDMHRAIAGSRLELFEGAGHFLHCEEPDRFVRVVHEFIRTTEPEGVPSDRPGSSSDRRPISHSHDAHARSIF